MKLNVELGRLRSRLDSPRRALSDEEAFSASSPTLCARAPHALTIDGGDTPISLINFRRFCAVTASVHSSPATKIEIALQMRAQHLNFATPEEGLLELIGFGECGDLLTRFFVDVDRSPRSSKV